MSIQVRSNEPKPVQSAPEAQPVEQEEKAAVFTEHSAPEAKEAPEHKDGAEHSEGSATEEAGESETEARESEQDTEAKDESAKEDKKPKKGGFQKRVDKLNARIADKEREAEYWKQVALKSAPAPETKPVDTKTEKASGEPDPNSFENHSEYVKAVAKWAAAEERKSLKAEQEKEKLQTENQKLVSTYLERKEAFSEKTPDFEDVISDVDDIPVSPAVRDIILSSENGPELAYQLAKNREDYARICKLPPLAAAREMGKLEARLAPKTSAQENKKLTTAPKPLEPVKSGGKGTTTKSIFDPDLSQAEYERLRAEQMKKRRQA